MTQKSNQPNGEQNMIKIDMNIGQITDRNLNVRWLRNIMIPVTTPKSPPILDTLIQVSLDGQALTGVILHRNPSKGSESQLSRKVYTSTCNQIR